MQKKSKFDEDFPYTAEMEYVPSANLQNTLNG
jgi:hypothetical protein